MGEREREERDISIFTLYSLPLTQSILFSHSLQLILLTLSWSLLPSPYNTFISLFPPLLPSLLLSPLHNPTLTLWLFSHMYIGITRVSDFSVSLPLSLFCEPSTPVKAALHKVGSVIVTIYTVQWSSVAGDSGY